MTGMASFLSGCQYLRDRSSYRLAEGAKWLTFVIAVVKEFQRKQLLERIERDGATIGARIPERITVQGKPVELQEFVFEIRRRETVPPGEKDRVERAKRNLRRERIERKEQIESGEITFEEGEEIARSIIGIDRALTELENLGPVDLEAEQRAQEAADRKRWMSFLKQALGNDGADGGKVNSRGGRR